MNVNDGEVCLDTDADCYSRTHSRIWNIPCPSDSASATSKVAPEIRLRCSRKISSRDWLAWSSSLMVCDQSSQTSPMVWCHWRTASLRPCFSSTPLDWPPTCQACVEHRGCCDLSATCWPIFPSQSHWSLLLPWQQSMPAMCLWECFRLMPTLLRTWNWHLEKSARGLWTPLALKPNSQHGALHLPLSLPLALRSWDTWTKIWPRWSWTAHPMVWRRAQATIWTSSCGVPSLCLFAQCLVCLCQWLPLSQASPMSLAELAFAVPFPNWYVVFAGVWLSCDSYRMTMPARFIQPSWKTV